MPATYTFPGIYIEEVPSDVTNYSVVSVVRYRIHRLLPASSVNEPIRITSFGDLADPWRTRSSQYYQLRHPVVLYEWRADWVSKQSEASGQKLS